MAELLNLVDITREPYGNEQDLPAGNFSSWLEQTRNALQGRQDAEVPCGECTACCTSSQFVHIGSEETETLGQIPADLLFPAPGQARGNMLLGYDADGQCPMLVDNRCSIYEHRPITCRTYDCRIFPAAGVTIGEKEKHRIEQRSRRWKFEFTNERERIRHAAVEATAEFLREHLDEIPVPRPDSPTRRAVFALQVYDVILNFHDESNKSGAVPDSGQIMSAILDARKRFESITE